MGPVNGKIRLDQDAVIRTPDLKNESYPGGMAPFYLKQMSKYSTRIAQIDAETGKEETFEELSKRSRRAAMAMSRKGVRAKDIVTTCSYNHMDSCVPYIASILLGAIPTAVDPSMSVNDIVHLLTSVKPKIIFVVPEAVALIEESLKVGGFQAEIIVFGEGFDKFLELAEDEQDFKPYETEDSKDTAIILFSSGTTGLPKGICLNHYSILNILENQVKSVDLNMALSYSTLYWVTGSLLLTAAMFTGATRLLVKEFDEDKFWHYVDKYKVTFMFLNLKATKAIAHTGPPKGLSTNSVRQFLTAGEFASSGLLQQICKHFPAATVAQGYGMTEAFGFITCFCFKDLEDRRLMATKPESCGKPVPGFDYKIVDVESGKTLGPDQPGELWVKSKYTMNGYYKMDSSSVFDGEGFLRTGDVLYYDKEFCFFVVDRIKEMLKFRGWHVPPKVIERILLDHPVVSDAVVVGIPSEEDGEHPMACVILKDGCEISEENLKRYVDDRVDDRKKLRGGVRFVECFPRTATGKINRRLLKHLYAKNDL